MTFLAAIRQMKNLNQMNCPSVHVNDTAGFMYIISTKFNANIFMKCTWTNSNFAFAFSRTMVSLHNWMQYLGVLFFFFSFFCTWEHGDFMYRMHNGG